MTGKRKRPLHGRYALVEILNDINNEAQVDYVRLNQWFVRAKEWIPACRDEPQRGQPFKIASSSRSIVKKSLFRSK